MFDTGELIDFTAMVSVMVIVPGPNTVVIVSSSLAGGRVAGAAAVLGIEGGTLVHTLAAALGLSALLASSPLGFDALRYAGAAYLALLGCRALFGTHRRVTESSAAPRPSRLTRTAAQAMLVSVLNPKAAVFFLALLPQFVHPERGNAFLQFVLLGGVVSAIGLVCGTALVCLASGASRWLRSDPVARWQERVSGGLLLALGVRLAL